MSKKTRCTGCGEPTDHTITIHGLTLAYHPRCAAAAARELRAVIDSVGAALAAWRHRGPASGSLPRVDEI